MQQHVAKGPDIVRLLLDHGARVEQGVEEPSLSALRNGNTDLVRTFLDLDLIPSQFNIDGVSCTPLHLAAVHAPVDTLKLLVSAGLDRLPLRMQRVPRRELEIPPQPGS
jgi:ankyrin repeat protein